MKTLRTENNAGSMQLSRKPRAIAHRNFLQRLASFAIPKQARSESRAARNCARSRRRAIAQPIEGNQLYPRIKLNFGHFCRFFIDTRDRSRARTYVRTWVYNRTWRKNVFRNRATLLPLRARARARAAIAVFQV